MILSIDLLTKFADDLQFEFELTRVADPKWGVLGRDGKWNGLMEAVVEKFVKYFKSILHHNSWYFGYFILCE